ncbi:MAG: alginate export family protein [Nitrospinaceae bacterium]|nr:alginate export family protein [Nitrospinaceae bacterium]NIR54898.1 alginate export family protein [Nitrospinaceae bacterium]NIS85326.1 alginate export family protein [Nitrospinaceae bacterium]NIT82136.1 alginate export family protein [Nitrospinaceae bacterium]NIU43198.1 alginate export family protein [Nitrospinaceae bacterium]
MNFGNLKRSGKANLRRLHVCTVLLTACVFFVLSGGWVWAAEADRWTLNETLGLPEAFSISGEHFSRYETLNSQFRANTTGSDQIWVMRSLLQVEYRFHKDFKIKGELQDSRAADFADEGTRINHSIVNTAELLEANFAWTLRDLFSKESISELRGGRLTFDFGKRRIVARNRFRSVIESFTGLEWKWKAEDGNRMHMFFTMPVRRRPQDFGSLLDNEARIDKESFDQILWGISYAPPGIPWGNKGEFILVGLHERDSSDFASRNRQLYIPSIRLYRPAQKGKFDFELQSVLQLGTSRATPAASDTRDLDHLAHFHHFETGYSFNTFWSPRFFFEYDFASGDRDPNDNTSERYENPFGPNVAEFGPTSIHTAFTRSNLSSPGARLVVHPAENLMAYLSYRAYWLVSSTDFWSGASRLRDISGNSKTFLGHQWVLRGQWRAHSNLHMESAVAYLIEGDYQKTVPQSPREGNSLYFYIQAKVFF